MTVTVLEVLRTGSARRMLRGADRSCRSAPTRPAVAPDPSGIIDRRVLVATDSLPDWPLEREELHVDLHVMPRDLFGIAMGMHGAPAHAIGQTTQPVAPQYAVDGGVRDAHALVARKYQTIRCGPR